MSTNWFTIETRLHKFKDLRTEQKMGRLNRLPKRDAVMLKRQLSHLQTYLGGIKYMTGKKKKRNPRSNSRLLMVIIKSHINPSTGVFRVAQGGKLHE
ncbi:hypothetical protein VitviT2T_004144 [Vitis vinifera]|uniref:Uncharacterized protein n=1 Tax=Vitis vinifera TaxID=29760 RepID=A0ABY9BPE5_VITVI|nr:hypothetical protein VitviT2T_004144 [Vitis vinifera]